MKSYRYRPSPKRFGCLAGLALFATSVHAAVVYTDSSSFASALQAGSYTEDYSGLAHGGTLVDTINFSGSGFSYSVSVPDGKTFYVNGDPVFGVNVPGLSTTDPGDAMTVNIPLGQNVTAVGALFTVTSSTESPLPGSFQLTLSDGTIQNITTTGGSPTAFRGFTTSGGTFITSLIIGGSTATTPPDFAFTSINELTVGYAAVPEPEVVASITALGLVGAAVARRRFRRR